MAVRPLLKPLLSRPADIFFTLYCLVHIPITLLIGTQNILPAEHFPLFLREALAGFAKNSGDPWLSAIVAGKALPPWWIACVVCEIFVQLPFFLYFPIAAIMRTPNIRIPSIIYGTHAATTLIPILFEVAQLYPSKISTEQLANLLGSYVPFLLIPLSLVLRMTVFWSEPVVSGKAKKMQ
ncbi:hypothetical protein HDU67_005365 [Dinochytrium kinnereticum]|nr:hypothetical protein HDU67_005365 [Dinochytrium kinnereticum]